jgi:hypothetical protein
MESGIKGTECDYALAFKLSVVDKKEKGEFSYKKAQRSLLEIADRRFPVSCSSAGYTETTSLQLPSSVQIERIPSDIRFQLGAIDYKAT